LPTDEKAGLPRTLDCAEYSAGYAMPYPATARQFA
jgi:hypothetical protein